MDSSIKKVVASQSDVAAKMTAEEYSKWILEKDTKFSTKHPFLKFTDEWYSHFLSRRIKTIDSPFVVEIGARKERIGRCLKDVVIYTIKP